MDAKDSEKKDRLLAALEKGMVMIHLDARRPGVLVPSSLRNEAHLRLNLSYRFDPPDLSVGEWGVRSTLSFSGSRFTVAVPWSALFAVTSQVTREFWMYPDDMPPELQRMVQQDEAGAAPPRGEPQSARAMLREVVWDPPSRQEAGGDPDGSPGGNPDGGNDEAPGEGPKKPTRRSHLRLVK
jgi:stringent starvation protein B